MQAVAVPVDHALWSLLPGSTFADAYRAPCGAADCDARQVSLAILESPPPWVDALMALRNQLVRPFGLKPGLRHSIPGGAARIGIFPVVTESRDQLVLGFDDRHLDFRVAVSLRTAGAGAKQVTVTTLVRTHNHLGRVYLRAILPFHRLIVRSLLERARGS
jgi:hypothetical protein